MLVVVANKKKGGKNIRLDVPEPRVERTVHWATLTAWLRRQVEENKFIPDLSKIGGFIGRRAAPKEVKEK